MEYSTLEFFLFKNMEWYSQVNFKNYFPKVILPQVIVLKKNLSQHWKLDQYNIRIGRSEEENIQYRVYSTSCKCRSYTSLLKF